MRHKQAWTIPADEARTLLRQIQRKTHRGGTPRRADPAPVDHRRGPGGRGRAAKALSDSGAVSVGPQRGPGSVMSRWFWPVWVEKSWSSSRLASDLYLPNPEARHQRHLAGTL